MSTNRFMTKMRRGAGLSVCSVLGGILIALQLMAPSTIFASSAVPADLGASRPLDQAGVSVVRLVVNYIPANSTGVLPNPTFKCTGLGVLVASKATTTDFTNWVLTDGALVNPGAAVCATSQAASSTLKISSIEVTVNTLYTGSTSTSFTIGTVASPTIRCQNTTNCTQGSALFTFPSKDPEPFVDVAPNNALGQLEQPGGIALEDSTGASPAQMVTTGNPLAFLIPRLITTGLEKSELGTPIVNSNGQMTGMHTMSNQATYDAIKTFLSNQTELTPPLQNDVHDNWNLGIADFYKPNYPAARTDFQVASLANPQFKAAADAIAAVDKASKATTATPTASPTAGTSVGSTTTTNEPSKIQIGPLSIPTLYLILVGIGVVLLLLIGLMILVSVRFGRARVLRRKQQEQEWAVAQRQSELQAQQIAEQEAQRQQAWAQPTTVIPPAAQAPVNTASAGNTRKSSDLRCPSCGHSVQPNATFCPKCGALLVATESGMHLRVRPSQTPPNAPAAPVPAATTQPRTKPGSSKSSKSSIGNETTIQLNTDKARNADNDQDKTLASANTIQQFKGPNLSLVVGTRSDPGIKRQHKPNEDSLFAAQGIRTHDSSPQQFGLFVVADGMGGHANGQDASRLAIQTIVDQMLPKLSGSGELADSNLVQLLLDGVQSANQAVHRRNQEQNGDAGTTMTAALVVGSTAYVANVGDSRTYLYRPPEGLRKVTNDHSVVASLVEAGIIKPDDIYTHPKRNQIYRSLGEKPVVEVDTFKIDLQVGDKLLLCSDGLWDMVRDPLIQQVLSTVPDPAQIGNALIKAAYDGGGEDNVSVIVVSVTEETKRTGMTGIQLLVKPDTVEMPKL